MVRLGAVKVKHFRVALEGIKVDALYEEVRLFAFFCYKHNLFNVLVVPDQHGLEGCVSLVKNKELLVLKRELKRDGGRLALNEL